MCSFGIDTIIQPRNRFIWSLLALQGGYVNVGGLLAIHFFVSHVTGYSAHFGIELISGNAFKSIYFLLVPLFFLLGAIFSALFTEIKRNAKEKPVYIQIMIALSIIYSLVALFGVWGFFGHFGEPFENFCDFILLALLAFACGAQNAIFTNYSQSIIRTTHLTGITTDLGIGIAKYFFSKNKYEGSINRIRIELILSFFAGSLLGALVFPKYAFSSFFIPSALSLVIGLRLFSTR